MLKLIFETNTGGKQRNKQLSRSKSRTGKRKPELQLVAPTFDPHEVATDLDTQATFSRCLHFMEALSEVTAQALQALDASDAEGVRHFLQIMRFGAEHEGGMLLRAGAEPSSDDFPALVAPDSAAGRSLRSVLTFAVPPAQEVDAEIGRAAFAPLLELLLLACPPEE